MGIQPCAKHFSPAVRKYFLSALALRLKTWSNHDVHPPTSLLGFFERKCLSLCLYYNPTVGVCVCVCACRCQTSPVRSVSITVSPTQWATDGGQTSVSYAAVFPTSQCSAPPTVHTLPLAALRWEDVCGCCSFLLAKATKNISTLVLLLCFKCCSPVATLVSSTDFTD